MLARVGFSRGELPGLVVGHVAPREAISDHFHVHEALPEKDPAHLPVVPIDVDHFDSHELAEHFVSKILSSLGPERLPLLRGVDAGETNLVLLVSLGDVWLQLA
jgi:hypothetical protein